LLRQLRAAFGGEAAAIHVAAAYPVTGGGPLATVGFEPNVRTACAGRWPTYLDELAPLARVAASTACVASDREAFSLSARSRKAYFREFVAPQGGADTLVAYLCLRNQPVAAISLALRASPWPPKARREIAALLPALSVAVASARCAAPQWVGTTRLTPREQQVLSGIDAGLTNSEIAACCGTSVNTVRNQVASLLCKLEATSRTELAARSLSAFVERHD
jgi:DNA-binding NarL/FixJ family response regulator